MPYNDFPKMLQRKELARNLSPKYYYFLSNSGLGDIYFLLCFNQALQSHLNGKIIFIVREYLRPVLELFDMSNYIIVTDIKRGNYMDLPHIAKKPHLGKIYPAHWCPLKKLLIGNTFKEQWLNLLGLPRDTAYTFPTNMPSISRDLAAKLSHIAPLDRIIFCFPDANSTRSLPRIILKAECEKAQKQGFAVMINTTKSKYDLPDTYNLHLPFKDAVALAINCHSVIAMRSGICDIIAPFCRHLKVYYTSETILEWNLKDNGLNSNAQELTIESALFGFSGVIFTLAYRFYKRIIARGLWRRIKCPFALLRLYLRYKDTPKIRIENQAQLKLYEYQLGLAVLRIYEARFNPLEICRFLRAYPQIRRLPRLKTLALAHRRHFKQHL